MIENEIKNSYNQDTHFEIKSAYLDDLNKKLDKNKIRKKVIFYFSTTILVLLISGITYFSITQNNTKTATNLNTKKIEKNLLNIDKKQINNTESSGYKNNIIPNINQKNEITKHIFTSQNTETQNELKNYTKDKNIKIPQKQITNSISQKSGSYTKIFNKEINIKKTKKFSKEVIVKKEEIKQVEKSNSNFESDEYKNLIKDLNLVSEENFNKFVIQYLENLNKQELAQNYFKNDSLPNNGFQDNIIFKKKIQFFLLVGTNTSFSNLTNFENQEYGNKRKKAEKTLTTFTTSLLLNKYLTENFVISSGFNYTTYGSNNNYSPTSLYKTENLFTKIDTVFLKGIDSAWSNTTRSKLYYYNGKTDTTTDSIYNLTDIELLDSTALKTNGKSSFNYIEIPIMIGYYKQINNWNFGLNTGISIGLLTNKTGYFVNEGLKSVSFSTSKKVLFNYILSPDISYKLNDKFSVGFQPFFKLGLNNLSISEPIDRKYYSIQLNAKISYEF